MLRILHTSDWHLGQSFHEFDRFDEHERFLGWLLETLDKEHPDALLVAGDVFDHANPSASSQRQLYRFLAQARTRHPRLDIVLIAGNHDSPGRLEAPSPLLDAFGVTIVGQVVRRDDGEVDVERLVVPLHDRDGNVAGWCLAVPFVRSSDLPRAAVEAAAVDAASAGADGGVSAGQAKDPVAASTFRSAPAQGVAETLVVSPATLAMPRDSRDIEQRRRRASALRDRPCSVTAVTSSSRGAGLQRCQAAAPPAPATGGHRAGPPATAPAIATPSAGLAAGDLFSTLDLPEPCTDLADATGTSDPEIARATTRPAEPATVRNPSVSIPRPAAPKSPYAVGLARLYQQAVGCALARSNGRQAIVALGHCHVAGGAITADSERPILAASLDELGPDVFDFRLAYVALGHFHRAQAINGDQRIRYAGSPLPLSFSEIDYPHQVVLAELDDDRLAGVRAIAVPRFAGLLRVPAEPAAASHVLAKLAQLEVPDVDDGLRPYLEVRVQLDGPEPGLRASIEAALTGKAVRLARIEITRAPERASPGGADGERQLSSLEDLARLQPDEVFRELHKSRFGSEPSSDLLVAFGELLRDSGEEGGR